jgi:hypothetical protein
MEISMDKIQFLNANGRMVDRRRNQQAISSLILLRMKKKNMQWKPGIDERVNMVD